MEVQVNVAQDCGERVEGEYKGKLWHGWTDHIQTWKSFRIPYKAYTIPEYKDKEMKFDLYEHAEGIGMTGWDWKNKLSRWVAFDFDAITDHSSKGLTNKELSDIQSKASEIPWVTLRHSTSGKGLHLYVMLEPIPTKTHTEHAALARSILGMMSALVGYDFCTKVDICGGNMWVWHRKMAGTNGLKIIKHGITLGKVPNNWKDHIQVIDRKRQRALPTCIQERNVSDFENLVNSYSHVPLDEDHKKLIKFLHDSQSFFWWDSDRYVLVAHTWDLMQAHENLNLKGLFKTIATGREHGSDHNCFCVPARHGVWIVRRFSQGVTEDLSWSQDENGWTRCYLNMEPTLAIAARTYEGIEDDKSRFTFKWASQAQEMALSLGTDLAIPAAYQGRKTVVRQHKDGQRIIVEFDRQPEDTQDQLVGWGVIKGNKWQKIFNTKRTNPLAMETANFDDLIRHLVTEGGSDFGWAVKSDGKWHDEPLAHTKFALESLGLKYNEIKTIIGNSVLKPWSITNIPFQDEYPGGRIWNRAAAQLRFNIVNKEHLSYPTWLKILNHVGIGLNLAIKENQWAQDNGLKTGADYLKCWVSSLFQFPFKPLPYLFLWGPQDCGKSIFHEALSLLLTKGYQLAKTALSSDFNAELHDAILCVVEEIDLKKDRTAYNLIKEYVTSLHILIHEKRKTPYQIKNKTHWIMCSNERTSCPIFPGDTRITMCYVDSLLKEEKIPKTDMLHLLEKEAPDFLTELLHLEIPKSNDRLNVPVITTDDSEDAASSNMNMLELFIAENCYYIPGNMILVKDFFDKFQSWLEPSEKFSWSKIKMGRSLPSKYPKGRDPKDAQWNIGNISFDPDVEIGTKLILYQQTLIPSEH